MGKNMKNNLEVGKRIEVEVKNINGHGEGVVNFEGDMIYVKNATHGKNKIEIIEIKRTFIIAQKI
jgi:predicted RNA-binding protein with TRAM domain